MWPFFARKSESTEEKKSLAWPDWQDLALFGAAPSAAGISITAETAMRCTPVAQAVALISGSIASLPIRVSRLKAGGIREELPPADYKPAAVLRRPNGWTGGVTFWRDLIADAVLTGNGIALVTRVRGEVRELLRVPPETVTIERDLGSFEPRFRITLAGGESRLYPVRDVIHLRGLPAADGLRGRGLTTDAREAIGLALLLEIHGAKLFANGARPGGVLKAPGKLTPDVIARLAASWKAAHNADTAGSTVILESGLDFTTLALKSTDAQFLELRRFAIAEIARAANVSPLLLGDLEKSTFSNAEIAAQNLLSFSLTPWIEQLEDELERVLLPAGDRDAVSIDFDYGSFAVADLEKRTAAAAKRIETGLSTINEERAALSRSPIAGGDLPRTSVQSQPLTASAATEATQ